MFGGNLKKEADRGIVYSSRVLIGNWYESAKLEEHKLNIFLEQMKKGDLMLARYRKMTDNLITPLDPTASADSIAFGSRVTLQAPYVPSTDPPEEGKLGLLLGGRISSNNINYSQNLEDGCSIVALPEERPTCRCSFTLMSADYCDRAAANEEVKYNQEFMLALSTSVEKKKPLFIRYDPNAIPGLAGSLPLYLSEKPVSNARWRFLPTRKNTITRFEQEGQFVQVNKDLIVNHVATNTNLGINLGRWYLGFYGKVCAPLMKTCLDIYGKELPQNIWRIYIPILD